MKAEQRFKKGDRVTYSPVVGERKHGIVKEVWGCEVFVVYHCNNEWDRFEDFTAASTPDSRLLEGWK